MAKKPSQDALREARARDLAAARQYTHTTSAPPPEIQRSNKEGLLDVFLRLIGSNQTSADFIKEAREQGQRKLAERARQEAESGSSARKEHGY